jgi:rhodanese-related sulfurtransferase
VGYGFLGGEGVPGENGQVSNLVFSRAARSTLTLAPALALWALAWGCVSAPVVVAPEPEVFVEAPEPGPGARPLGRTALGLEVVPALTLPPATRQLAEGYWLGAMFEASHVPTLRAIGVRVVLSAVRPSEEALEALASAGIRWVGVPMGATFAHAGEILGVADRHAPDEIFVHCRHGADRTGAIAAFLLAVRHGWRMSDALYSVVYASGEDVAGVAERLQRYGIEDVRAPDDPTVGFYSVRAAGGVGGMKARNERYARLVTTTIEAAWQQTGGSLFGGAPVLASEPAEVLQSPR